jgi:hypothetical protein
MLTEQDITNFQTLFKSEFGKDIDRAEAFEQGLKLVGLLSNVYKPMTQEEFDEIERHRRVTLLKLTS